MRRHKKFHLLATLNNARNAQQKLAARSPVDAVLVEANRPVNLLEQVDDLYDRARRLLDKAENAGKFSAAASAVREATRLTELLGRLQGDLTTGTTITTQVLITQSPEWLDLRGRLLAALRPHPEALEAVQQALLGAEASDEVSDEGPESGP